MRQHALTNWIHGHHLGGHDVLIRCEHMLNSPRFWTTAGLVGVMVLLIVLALLSVPTDQSAIDTLPWSTIPGYPFLP